MPVLKRYADGDGHYVQAAVSDRNRPITLQCSELTVELYRQAGYEPDIAPAAGIDVPGELTWTMYDVGLHWTKSEIDSIATDGGTGNVPRDGNGSKLSESAVDQIEAFLAAYDGASRDDVEELLRRLREGERTDSASSGSVSGPRGIWSTTESQRDRYADALSSEIRRRLGAANARFDVNVEMVLLLDEENPPCTRVDVLLTASADSTQYLHQLYVCEQHGLEHCSTKTEAVDWSERLEIEAHRTLVLQSLVDVAEQLDVGIGDPNATFRAQIEVPVHESQSGV